MTIINFFNKTIASGVVLAQIFIFLAVIYLLFFRKKQNIVFEFIGKNGVIFAFGVSLTATLGSLFYSQFAGFKPCNLCWIQRIFMYPEFILLGFALIKKNYNITNYVLSFSFIGWLISIYHNYIYYYNSGLNSYCQLLDKETSCVKRYVFELGYITIPLMSLTAFTLIIIFLILYKLSRLNRGSLMPTTLSIHDKVGT